MLERLKQRLPDGTSEALLQELLQSAEGIICAYTARTEMPEALSAAQLEIAVILFNRMGMEGESAHVEGSISRSAESLPEFLRRQLNPWRLARAVGK